MTKACLALAFFCLFLPLSLKAFEWGTATSNGREYVTLQSFCSFYGLGYAVPSGNEFATHSAQHSLRLKAGSPDIILDGVHFVMSFPVEGGDRDWLVSRMDVIKLFDPVLRPTEISGRHAIRGVVIDAGHGGSDNGATSRLGAEKDYTRDTAFRLEAILRGEGLKTVLTRRTDVFVDLYERAHIASLYSDYAFVSIHFNSAMPEARGLETYCLSPRGAASTSSAYLSRSDIQKLPGNDYDAQNVLLAAMVHSEIIKLNPGDSTADRGVKRARFVVIKQNVLPAILVEGGFVSNRMEAARVNRSDYRQSLAESIARGVTKFINVMGDKNMPLPGSSKGSTPASAPAPKVIAATPPVPPAPSGLAHDPLAPKSSAPTPAPTTVAPKVDSASATTAAAAAAATGHKSKKSKNKKVVAATPELSKPPEPAPAALNSAVTTNDATNNAVTAAKPTTETPSGPLNLSEPSASTPTAEADKAPPEPDEPPVNIYPTTTTKSSGSMDAPTVSTVPPVSNSSAPSTNAPPSTSRPSN